MLIQSRHTSGQEDFSYNYMRSNEEGIDLPTT